MQFIDEYEQINPGCCAQPFAMPEAWVKTKKRNREGWFCPNCGSSRIFRVGDSPEVKARKEAERRAAEAEMQAAEARSRARDTSRRYRRMRDRVRNGVCPCCNRTFENLARHIATKHPDFGKHKQLRTLRQTFGLTQSDLAEETGVPAGYVSMYENNKPLPEWAEEQINQWVESEAS